MEIILLINSRPFAGLSAQHANVASLAAASAYYSSDQHSPVKYPENGHDTFTDFVTFVCQEADSNQGGQVSEIHDFILYISCHFAFLFHPLTFCCPRKRFHSY